MDEYDIHRNKLPNKTYVSKRLTLGSGRAFRIASKVIDSPDGQHFARELQETVIRRTAGGRQEIIAKFTEDDRQVFRLILQRWDVDLGRPLRTHFTFLQHEVLQLLEFLLNLKRMHLPDDQRINITDDELRRVLLSRDQAAKVFLDNEELVLSLLRNEITTQDVVALGYRRKQLQRFEALLQDQDATEPVWQAFFEENRWIFGYGLAYVSFAGMQDRKLEQVVQGASVASAGKRADALLKTQAAISSLCFVEIKRHTTELLRQTSNPYRSGAWQPSSELTGGVAQSHATVHAALQSLGDRVSLTAQDGSPTGEDLLNIDPRSYLIIGDLSQFQTEHGLNDEKFRSFELFRRNLRSPEIITFDELLHRAKFIVTQEDAKH